MKIARIISLIFFAITLFVSIDLLINYLGSRAPFMNDGITIHTIIPGQLYFGDSLWSQERFFNAFVTSSMITFAVFLENIVLYIISIAKKNA